VPDLLTALALVGIVLVLAALASGLVERAPISFPVIFLGLGFLLGQRGLGMISIGPHDRTLEGVALISLALVLFLDAVRMRFDRSAREWLIPILVLGPGTLLVVALVAGAAHLLAGTSLLASILLGAILSSTDPVVLRDVVRDKRIPPSIRQALTVEAGTNDLVVLPIVLIGIAAAKAEAASAGDWILFLAKLLLLGPAVGFAVGAGGAWLMMRADRRYQIRREYQALFGLGLVFAAYVGGVAVGGDGFLAAFAAGAAIAALDLELCDCFLEYGDATAEMIMLFAFILFGAVLSTLVGTVPLGPALLLAAITIVLARPLAIGLVLRRASLSPSARAFIGWFGPRGLNSLLLSLLVVQASVEGGERLLALAGIVVIVSVIVHGTSATPVTAWYARKAAAATLAEERVSTAEGLLQGADPSEVPRITPRELAARLAGPNPPVVLDVRARASYEKDPTGIPGGLRVAPDHVAEWAAGRKHDESIVAYCT
jgi:NhaP-type Na+/H+ or K+/H+ antiporter